ncbi:zliS Lysozyme family protein [uncultured Caudovirales phage]|jgi:lysozyme family protein|uniref:ZliS Lysozyme family protein n=1 Tax=uncultured Caudovirales phage TaxID=2100421 RepID=A0A6J5T0Y9_9CAUD|nr:zliS Lysozyme family protein [uncultured Caudovirales phage]CAB4167379.1 zliS Lysozyme family protein [uncultured Caudovirales phage]CAB4173541.1 zliS Lysozyme family protein [uncultured Caudovirales phage]CAB4178815.1 zliS Lysozyme family protein [uncultured Caudovirales phage]CAB4188614.1 zliS Lysozyme family protein [uncultured Caudovirales phage]
MSADFNIAVDFVLKHEGGYSNHTNDPGGPTNFGISLRLLEQQGIDIDGDGDIDIDDIKGVTKTRAKEIYKELWWDKYHYENIESTEIAKKVFDVAVNAGASRAHKITQRAINRITSGSLAVDGVLGPKTLSAINRIITRGNYLNLYQAIQKEQELFYIDISDKNIKLRSFIRGWLARAKQ